MAEKFLDALPRVDLEMLSEECKCCMICLVEYSAETKDDSLLESAVRLPCGHDVGAECIRTWLSPQKEARNSCPACRMTFFPAQPRPYMENEMFEVESGDEFDSEDEDEDDWHGLRNGVTAGEFLQYVLRMIGEDGQPRSEGQAESQREEAEGAEMIRSLCPHFFGTTTEQYEESIRRARVSITTPKIPHRGADLDAWLPYPYLQLSRSQPIDPENLDPQHVENVVQALATAFRTLSFREALLYGQFSETDSNGQYSISRDDSLRPLSAEQEEELFWKMLRGGAFATIESSPLYFGLTFRQTWQVHRENGEAWNAATGLWSQD